MEWTGIVLDRLCQAGMADPHDLESPVVDRPCVLCVFPHHSIESLYRLHCVATGVDDNSRLWILYFTVSVCDEEFPIE